MAIRKDERAANVSILLVSTMLGAVGQLFFKYAFTTGPLPLWMAVGLGAYLLSTVFYFIVLSRAHLSWTYGIGGLSYVFATILAATVLGEAIPPLRWAGVGVIFLGVVLIGSS